MLQGIDLRQYLDYSGDDFQCFSPCRGDPLHRLGEEVDHMNFIQSVQEWGVGPENCNFYEILEYQWPIGAYRLCDS